MAMSSPPSPSSRPSPSRSIRLSTVRSGPPLPALVYCRQYLSGQPNPVFVACAVGKIRPDRANYSPSELLWGRDRHCILTVQPTNLKKIENLYFEVRS